MLIIPLHLISGMTNKDLTIGWFDNYVPGDALLLADKWMKSDLE